MRGLELLIVKEMNTHGVSVCLKPCLPEVITPTLVNEIRLFQNSLAAQYYSSPWEGYFYVIWYSHRGHGICGRGLDFNYILQAINTNKESALEDYVRDLFDLLFLNYVGLGLPIVNCSIVDRKLTGISQEFFFLNKINFIKSVSSNETKETVFPVEFNELANNPAFPLTLYQNNLFYKFCSFDLKMMKKYIGDLSLPPFDPQNLDLTRLIFDEMEEKTLTGIYRIATTNIKLLERFAKRQSNHN